MKKLIFVIPIIVILAIIAAPAALYSIAEIEKARVEQIEAETQKMRAQIDADNARHWRAKDWYHTASNTVMIALLVVAFVRKSQRDDKKLIDLIDWVVRREK